VCSLAAAGALVAFPAYAATYVVNQATDDSSGVTPGTLSWAINQANGSPNNTISFVPSIPTITVTGTLPTLVQPTILLSSAAVGIRGGTLTGAVNLTISADSVLSGGVAADSASFTGLDLPTPVAGTTLLTPSGGTISNSGQIIGGTGAAGANNNSYSFDYVLGPQGGKGGAGAAGVTGTNFSLVNSGTITGGKGGVGGAGAGGTQVAGPGNFGGNGGAGVHGSGFSLNNSGTITGGVGGAGGLAALLPSPGVNGAKGADGVGVIATGGATIRNSGTIAGVGGANAVELSGTGNRLILEVGYNFVGNVVSSGGDTLSLGGTTDASFSLADLGAAARFQGFNELTKQDASTWTLTGTGAYSGQTTVSAGTLVVNGSTALSTLTSVASGARLGGSGTVGATSIAAGGILAPGNSIGTLHVAGNLTLASGAYFDVEFNDGGTVAGINNDLVTVGGTATIDNATLRIGPVTGAVAGNGYVHGATYTILSAANPVQGRFGTVANDFAFLATSLDYTSQPDKVLLTLLRKDRAYSSVANNPNQAGVGRALESFDADGPVIGQVIGMTDAEARDAFDQMSGEMHASGGHVLQQTFRLFQSSLGGGRQGPGNSRRQDSTVLNYGAEPGTAVASLLAIDEVSSATYPVHSAWLKPLAGLGTISADTSSGRLEWWAAGLSGGYEIATTLEGGSATFGLGLGYIANGSALPARRSTSSGQGGQLAVYSAWSDGIINLAGSLSYGATHVSTRREIVVGTLTNTAIADYWAQNAGLALEASYAIPLNDQFSVRPVGTLNTGWSGQAGATETGAGALNLTTAASGQWYLETGIGAALDYSVALADGGELTLSGQALWGHAFGNVTPEQSVSLAGGGGAFAVSGAELTRDILKVGTGLSLAPATGPKLSLDYEGAFSSMQANHVVTARAALAF
jgi:autotransporter-associated beta strand protein